ncbi:MAG: ParA family protein [Nitrospirae bacterium]|nr:ParA family protein [Nitrospirota bacterium]
MADGQQKAKVISFINFKGGVGKTSNTVNIAGELAIRGNRVLVIDTDPQSNSTVWLMGENNFEKLISIAPTARNTVNTLFQSRIFPNVYKFDIGNAIRGYQWIDRLFLFPAEYDMIDIENHLSVVPFAESILRKVLIDIAYSYEYILIDCPPNLYKVTRNALYVSDYFIIPCIPDYLSKLGLHILVKKIQEFTEVADRELKLLGIILNKGSKNVGVFKDGKAAIEDELKKMIDKKTYEKLVDDQATIFKTWITDFAGVSDAVSEVKPLCLLKGRGFNQPKKLYHDLTQEIVALIKSRR